METAIPIAAATNAALLAAALAMQSLPKRAHAGLFASAFLMTAAAAVALIAIDHSRAGASPATLFAAEGALTFASGPLFLLFAAASVGARIDMRILACALVVVALAAIAATRVYPSQLVADRLAVVQMAFTATSAVVVMRSGAVRGRVARSRNFVIAAIAGLAILHAAQLVRTFWPEARHFRDIVLYVGSAALFALSASVFFGGRLGFLESLTEPPRIATDAMRALVARLEAALSGGLLKRADLTVQEAAGAIGASADAVTDAVHAVTGAGFAARLLRLRVEEAQRLLADPGEARTSMEAIGLLAGFGSRSAFYQAFGEHVGMSPAAYRRSLGEKPVQNARTGQVW